MPDNGSDAAKVREMLLSLIEEQRQDRQASLQMGPILRELRQRLDSGIPDKVLLEEWYGLFRSGHLCWGYNLSNAKAPFFHVSPQGQKALESLSRDPANPRGYLNHLAEVASLNAVAESYIQEALRTYNADCPKATAVLVGGAAESVVLEVRDALVGWLEEDGHNVPRKLQDWRAKRVLDTIQDELQRHRGEMPRLLRESFESYWPAFAQQIRAARNDAGHPSSIEPVTDETVHASLLIFPELCRLATRLASWLGKEGG